MIGKITSVAIVTAALAGAAAAQETGPAARAGQSAPTSINSAATAGGAGYVSPEVAPEGANVPPLPTYGRNPSRAYGGYRGYSYLGPSAATQPGGGWYGEPPGPGAAASAAGVGSVAGSLPKSCKADGPYYRCGDVWYQPQYMGSSVSYVVVPSPF